MMRVRMVLGVAAVLLAGPALAQKGVTTKITQTPNGSIKRVTQPNGSYLEIEKSRTVEGKYKVYSVELRRSINHPKGPVDPDYGRPDNIYTERGRTFKVRSLPLGLQKTKVERETFESVSQRGEGPVNGMNGSSGTKRSDWYLSRGNETLLSGKGKVRYY